MGRYVSDASNGQPRRHVVRVTSSNPNIVVPEWARNGGVIYATGCGAGSSGVFYEGIAGVSTSGAQANGHKIFIPLGTESVAVMIGAGGASTTVNPYATPGGDTVIFVEGVEYLRLGGGSSSGPGIGGIPKVFGKAAMFSDSYSNANGSANPDTIRAAMGSFINKSGVYASLSSGVTCRSAGGFGENFVANIAALSGDGAPSSLGAAGIGYGYGGVSGPAAETGGNGLMILEFVEAHSE